MTPTAGPSSTPPCTRPIAQWAVILDKPDSSTSASDKATAEDFLTYLLSSKGQAVLASFGYEALP